MNDYRYRVVVNGSGACTAPAISTAATLTVVTSVTITSQPADQVACAGNSVAFSVAGSGSGIIYQWQESTDGGNNWNNITNGGIYSGANGATLTINPVTTPMSGYRYRAQLSNNTCSTPGISNAVLLTVNSSPAIGSHPQNATICENGNANFIATVTGTNLIYQWEVSTDGGNTWNDVLNGGVYSGATTNTLSVTGAGFALNNNRYRLSVSGLCPPALQSNAAILTVVQPVLVTQEPIDVEICSGEDATFTVAGAPGPVNYQWQVSTNGGSSWNNIAGANSSSYTVSNALFVMNNNRYRALLSNNTCTTPAISDDALLTVRNVPTVNLTASPLTSLLPGQTTTITALIGGASGGLISYAWLYNGVAAPGITGNTKVVGVDSIGTYQVAVQETWPSGLVCANLSPLITITATASSRLFIYPSPNDGRFSVAYYNEGGVDTKRVLAIFDSKGAMVYNRTFQVSGFYTLLPVDLQQVNTGIYYVVIGDALGKKLAEGKVHIR